MNEDEVRRMLYAAEEAKKAAEEAKRLAEVAHRESAAHSEFRERVLDALGALRDQSSRLEERLATLSKDAHLVTLDLVALKRDVRSVTDQMIEMKRQKQAESTASQSGRWALVTAVVVGILALIGTIIQSIANWLKS